MVLLLLIIIFILIILIVIIIVATRSGNFHYKVTPVSVTTLTSGDLDLRSFIIISRVCSQHGVAVVDPERSVSVAGSQSFISDRKENVFLCGIYAVYGIQSVF